MTTSDPAKEYRQAERRLREMLFGDGANTVGVVKGEERRILATKFLRRMRDAFEAAVAAHDEARAETAEGRIADLEDQLRTIAAASSRERSEAHS
jgi:hypothetical protein